MKSPETDRQSVSRPQLKRGRYRWLATTLVVVLGSCGDPFALLDGSFHGHYAQGFEINDFLPCGARDGQQWWVVGSIQSVEQFMRDHSVGTVYVRWRGELSDEGLYGNGLERELDVTEVMEVREVRSDDCR